MTRWEIDRLTLWLCELSLFHTSLDRAVELSIERCARGDVLVVREDVFLKGRATIQKGWVSKRSIKITRPQR